MEGWGSREPWILGNYYSAYKEINLRDNHREENGDFLIQNTLMKMKKNIDKKAKECYADNRVL